MIPTKLYTRSDFYAFKNAVVQERLQYEQKIAESMKGKEIITLKFYCEICNRSTPMTLDWKHSINDNPNFRERLVCSICRLNSRLRFMLGLIKRLLDENPEYTSLYLYEQITPIFKYLQNNLVDEIKITGSEYLGFDKKPGQIINGVRHEDATKLSFADNSFDLALSNEVFEHVPDIDKTLTEAHRIMKPKGKLLISIPFTFADKTLVRAKLENGNIIYLEKAIYHGNPLDEKGSLVFYDYGWDFLDMCNSAGFRDTYLLAYYDIEYGYIGHGMQFIFVAES